MHSDLLIPAPSLRQGGMEGALQHRLSPDICPAWEKGRHSTSVGHRRAECCVFSLIFQFIDVTESPSEDVRSDKLVKGRTQSC